MELLTANIRPLKYELTRTFSEAFSQFRLASDRYLMASGYASTDALLLLRDEITQNSPSWRPFDLVIGMAKFEPISRWQYELLKELDAALGSDGCVYVASGFPFHGKCYSFELNSQPIGTVLGSSNLSALAKSIWQYEVDIAITDEDICNHVSKLIRDLRDGASIPVREWKPKSFANTNRLLQGVDGVQPMPPDAVDKAKGAIVGPSFRLKLKPEPKSNLNVPFGKGRVNPRGEIRNRTWYEAEIIVGTGVTSQPGYPANQEFDVITDDGWKFRCKTSGDYSKNFRSADDLQILGMWLKGRLESAGLIFVGDRVTEQNLIEYGKDYVVLSATSDPNIWYLDFSR